jgi:hypothetical protein
MPNRQPGSLSLVEVEGRAAGEHSLLCQSGKVGMNMLVALTVKSR